MELGASCSWGSCLGLGRGGADFPFKATRLELRDSLLRHGTGLLVNMKLVLTALALDPSRELLVRVVARNVTVPVQSPKLVQGGQLFSPIHVM